MPIYEYACKECGHTLDALQKVADAPLTDCPECGKAALRRLISAPRFRLKGDGWYETDFKKKNRRNLVTSDSEAPKSEGSKTDKSDAKADTGKKEKPATTAAAREKTVDTG